MPIKIKPLTKKQLIELFKVYREAFPDWKVDHGVVLTRAVTPIRQSIAFQALRSGAYRPSCRIQILLPIPDGCSILVQHLDVKHREVFPREHATKWPLVLKAMEEQFLPSIRKPLDAAETLELGEVEARRNHIDNINYTTGLAALSAYLGETDRAAYWCDRVDERLTNLGRSPAEWESRKAEFVHELRRVIAGRR